MMQIKEKDQFIDDAVAKLKELHRTDHDEFKRVVKALYLQLGKDYQANRSTFRSSNTYQLLTRLTGRAPPEGLIALLVGPSD